MAYHQLSPRIYYSLVAAIIILIAIAMTLIMVYERNRSKADIIVATPHLPVDLTNPAHSSSVGQ